MLAVLLVVVLDWLLVIEVVVFDKGVVSALSVPVVKEAIVVGVELVIVISVVAVDVVVVD